MKDPFEILEVAPQAGPEVINAVYRALLRKHRPDQNPGAGAADLYRRLEDIHWAKRELDRDLEGWRRRVTKAESPPAATAMPAGEAGAGAIAAPRLPAIQVSLPVLAGTQITAAQALLAVILLIAVFTRFYRLGSPNVCYFDEVYFPTTGAEILHGRDEAWNFYGHENTHPPLSKEFMALGQGIFGTTGSGDTDNHCWPDADDKDKKGNPDWRYSAFGWRFFGAVAGVGAVVFIYLLAKQLFQSEVAGLAAATLLTVEGLAFTQARIATPDAYVLFFLLGSVYFLVSNRFLLSGIFFGAAAASKWNAALIIVPIVLYLAVRFLRGLQDTSPDARLRAVERALLGGLGLIVAGGALGVAAMMAGDGLSPAVVLLGGAPAVLGALVALATTAVLAANPVLRRTPRGRLYIEIALVFPVFFLIVPFYIYALTYIPALLNGQTVGELVRLNRSMYEFHSSLDQPHSSSSAWWKWPLLIRPVFFYLGSGETKIYNLGNPVIFWLGIPALVFVLWKGLNLRARLNSESGSLRISAAVSLVQWPLLFVVLSYLGFWLPWAAGSRVLFLYHYLPALAFLILAMAWCVDYLWRQALPRDLVVGAYFVGFGSLFTRFTPALSLPGAVDVVLWGLAAGGAFAIVSTLVRTASRPGAAVESDPVWGRYAAMGVLAAAVLTFIYFYPHLTAIDVSRTVDESYYWLRTWR